MENVYERTTDFFAASDRQIRIERPTLRPGVALLYHRKMNIPGIADDPETVKHPKDDDDHHDNVEDFFDRGLHRDISVDQPEDHTDDDQSEDNVN